MGQLALDIQQESTARIPDAPVLNPAQLLDGPGLLAIFGKIETAVAALELLTRGARIVRTPGVPSDTNDGEDGDLAINLASSDLYAKNAGHWTGLFKLKGDKGDNVKGDTGLSAYQLAQQQGFVGTLTQWLASLGKKGDAGQSTYQLAQQLGFTGTAQAWLATLKGDPGDPGQRGSAIRWESYAPTNEDGLVGDLWVHTISAAKCAFYKCTASANGVGSWSLRFTSPDPGTTTSTGTTGSGSLTLADGSVSESKLAPDVLAKLNQLISGAPQWVAGPQTAGTYVYDQGLVYKVLSALNNGTAHPAASPAFYQKIGSTLYKPATKDDFGSLKLGAGLTIDEMGRLMTTSAGPDGPAWSTIVAYRTLYLKDFGVKADSQGAMETDKFGTDDHDAIQKVLDINKTSGEHLRIVGSVDFSGTHGFSLVNTPATANGPGRMLRINSNTEVDSCGFLRADGANCKMFLNANPVGMKATGPGSELADCVDHDITFRNCVFNGNSYRGTTPYNVVDQTSADGWSYLVHLAGVDRANFLGSNRFINQSTFSIMLSNCLNVKAERLYFRCADGATYQTDGIKIWCCYNVDIDYIQARTFDDAVSCCANNGLRNDNLNDPSVAGHIRYDKYAVYGRCDLIRIRRLVLEGGYGVRLLSGDQLLSNVRVDSIEGWTNQQLVIMGEQDQSGMFMRGGLPTGGHYKNIRFDSITAQCLGKQYYPATIWLAGATGMTCDNLYFGYIYRTANQIAGIPTIQSTLGFNCDYMTIAQMYVKPDANNDNPLFQHAGTVSNLNMRNIVNDRAAVSLLNGTSGGAALKMQTGGLVRKLTASNWDSNAVTTDIDYSGGSILNIVGDKLDYTGTWCTVGSGKTLLQADIETARPHPIKPLFGGAGKVNTLRGYVFAGVSSYNGTSGAGSTSPNQYVLGANFVAYSDPGPTFQYLGGTVANASNTNAISGTFNVLMDAQGYEIIAVPTGAIGFELLAQTSRSGSITATINNVATALALGTVNVYVSLSDGQPATARANVLDGSLPATMVVDNPNTSAYPWAWYRYLAPTGLTLALNIYISGQTQKFPNEGINWLY